MSLIGQLSPSVRSNQNFYIEFLRSGFEYLRPAAANHEFGAKLHHAPAHRFAESGAPASNQHALLLEKIGLEHSVSLF